METVVEEKPLSLATSRMVTIEALSPAPNTRRLARGKSPELKPRSRNRRARLRFSLSYHDRRIPQLNSSGCWRTLQQRLQPVSSAGIKLGLVSRQVSTLIGCPRWVFSYFFAVGRMPRILIRWRSQRSRLQAGWIRATLKFIICGARHCRLQFLLTFRFAPHVHQCASTTNAAPNGKSKWKPEPFRRPNCCRMNGRSEPPRRTEVKTE